MNEDLMFRVLKRILIRQHDTMALVGHHIGPMDKALIEEIDRELESYEEAKHG